MSRGSPEIAVVGKPAEARQPGQQGTPTDGRRGKTRVLTLSTIGFTLAFAVWMMFGVLGIPIRKELGLNDVELGWLLAASVLSGSLLRLPFGVLTDLYGGRLVFSSLLLVVAVPTYLVSTAHSYLVLLGYALLFGMAGNTFSVGIAWCSAWYPKERQGFALGTFGAGNVGASVTKFIGPGLIAIVPATGLLGGLVPGGWRIVPVLYTVLLVIMAAAIWWLSPNPDRKPGTGRSYIEMLRPLRHVRVWRFGLYYVVVFGAYVALALWLPKYYVDVFGLSLPNASLLTAIFIFPASLMRPPGGWLTDVLGARPVMYVVFGAMTASTFLLFLPGVVTSPWTFTALMVVVGVVMGVGKAAVYKYIPDYFPKDVGAVGGLVGLLGALGGFFLPPVFGYMRVWTGQPQSIFLVLCLLSAACLIWLHLVVLSIRRSRVSQPQHAFETVAGSPGPSEAPPIYPAAAQPDVPPPTAKPIGSLVVEKPPN